MSCTIKAKHIINNQEQDFNTGIEPNHPETNTIYIHTSTLKIYIYIRVTKLAKYQIKYNLEVRPNKNVEEQAHIQNPIQACAITELKKN